MLGSRRTPSAPCSSPAGGVCAGLKQVGGAAHPGGVAASRSVPVSTRVPEALGRGPGERHSRWIKIREAGQLPATPPSTPHLPKHVEVRHG